MSWPVLSNRGAFDTSIMGLSLTKDPNHDRSSYHLSVFQNFWMGFQYPD